MTSIRDGWSPDRIFLVVKLNVRSLQSRLSTKSEKREGQQHVNSSGIAGQCIQSRLTLLEVLRPRQNTSSPPRPMPRRVCGRLTL